MSLPVGVACDKSSRSSSTRRPRRPLLLDCTDFSDLLVIIVVDTAAFSCIIEDSATILSFVAVSGSSNWTSCSLLDVTLPADVACDKSSWSSSTIRRRLLLLDCTAFSELILVIVVDTAAAFFCIVEDSAAAFFCFLRAWGFGFHEWCLSSFSKSMRLYRRKNSFVFVFSSQILDA